MDISFPQCLQGLGFLFDLVTFYPKLTKLVCSDTLNDNDLTHLKIIICTCLLIGGRAIACMWQPEHKAPLAALRSSAVWYWGGKLNLGHPVWQQASLPTEPLLWLVLFFLKCTHRAIL